MTKSEVELGIKYLAEIDALQHVSKICSAYGWQRHCLNENIANKVSTFGNDYGKSNADDLTTELAKGNRAMFAEMNDIVNLRIDVVKTEFQKL